MRWAMNRPIALRREQRVARRPGRLPGRGPAGLRAGGRVERRAQARSGPVDDLRRAVEHERELEEAVGEGGTRNVLDGHPGLTQGSGVELALRTDRVSPGGEDQGGFQPGIYGLD